MAAPKGILALVGGREPDDDEGGGDEAETESGDSPKARAMRDLGEALSSKNWDAAGHAFERAYMICKQGKSESSSSEESEEEAEDYEV